MSSMGRAGDEFDDEMDSLGDRVEQFEDAGRRGLEIIQDGFNDLYDGLADESGRVLEAIEENIEEHPWLSLCVGLGIGFLIGSALFRRL
jgi:ElaB/YqjD/DUF883 family membrane-anchored ribosome-binding protein